MARSRNPMLFLRRHNMVDDPPGPSPRLDIGQLKVHTTPLTKPRPSSLVLEAIQGGEPTDRAATKLWPGEPSSE